MLNVRNVADAIHEMGAVNVVELLAHALRVHASERAPMMFAPSREEFLREMNILADNMSAAGAIFTERYEETK